jgi:hypothetical protein
LEGETSYVARYLAEYRKVYPDSSTKTSPYDSHRFSSKVENGTPAIAWIDGCIKLYKALTDQNATNDATSHREIFEANRFCPRVAENHDFFAHSWSASRR